MSTEPEDRRRPPVGSGALADEQVLADMLCELIDELHHGGSPNVEAYASRHPRLGDDLRRLWATASLADDLVRSPDASPGVPSLERDPEGIADFQTSPSDMPRRFGDYLLLEELGRGGMGVVYKARQESLDRTVAVKMILRGELASKVDLARFRAEASSAARLAHPHTVPVHEVGEIDGRLFFSMKYVAGETLASRLHGGAIPPRDAAQLLIPVCRAVADAHRSGVLHRDLKPSNILIDADGRPFVSDFGLAKRMQSDAGLTGSGAIVGTPDYMAPEQAAGNRGDLGPASDVFSLGCILYHMLTGRPPFQAATPVDTVLRLLEQEPIPPRLLNPAVNVDLELIVTKCLQKPADLRYASADDLADDLAAFLAEEPVSARRTNLRSIFSRMLRESHHAHVLENWGVLWLWHAAVLLVLCLTTNWMQYRGFDTPEPYLALWILGLGTWASAFWALRRRIGPITFVERQIAHVWAGSVLTSVLLFVVEILLKLPVLTLSPVLGLTSGMVFLVKAGVLSGVFYFQAAALFATGVVMALWPDFGLTIFGVVSAACFFVPGLKYRRLRRRTP